MKHFKRSFVILIMVIPLWGNTVLAQKVIFT